MPLHTLRCEYNWIVRPSHVRHNEALCQTLGSFPEVGSKCPSNSLGNTEADDLNVHVGNVSREIIFDQSVKCLSSFFFQNRIGSQLNRRGGKVVAWDRTQGFRDSIGVFDRSQSLEGIQIIDQDGDGSRAVRAQEGGESEKNGGIGEDDLQMLSGKELLGANFQGEGLMRLFWRSNKVE